MRYYFCRKNLIYDTLIEEASSATWREMLCKDDGQFLKYFMDMLLV
jgi:hypothetical protein